jgi:hypothetical protein
MILLKLLKNRKNAHDIKEFKKGFDYACGVLLRMELTPLDLEQFIESNKINYGVNCFDKGVFEAINVLSQGIKIINNINYK